MPAPRISIQPEHLQERQPLPPQSPQLTSTSTLGSVNGKKCGRTRMSRSAPKIAARSASSGALEVGQGDALVDDEALDLVEHRRVGRVGVAPVDLAEADDVDRRRLLLHHAHLHRRGVGAQQDAAVGVHDRSGIVVTLLDD